jgi:aerobic carbon-monoxide dehydrogenase medium subunit
MWNLTEILHPPTLAEAVRLLRRPNVKTAILAGGTTLVPQARRDVQSLVDLRDLKLAYIKREGNALRIGATTTLQDIATSPNVPPVLVQAAHASAPINVRNAATLGGVLASSGFNAPLPVMLLALDAVLVIYSPEARQSPLSSFLAYREKLLRDGALIAEVGLPFSDARMAFEKVSRTPSDAPIVCVAVKLRLDNGVARDGVTVRDVRLAVGGVGPLAVRLARAELALEGKPLTESLIAQAAEAAAKEVNPPSDFLASSEYRKEMVKVLVRRALTASS